MAFLNREQVKYLEDLKEIPNVTVLNRNGNPKKVKAFLLGPNKCKLTQVYYRETKKTAFIQVVFEREKIRVNDKWVHFGPIKETIFSNELERINELANCFGHEFPTTLPNEYTIEAFLRALTRRLNTFINQELTINVVYQKRIMRDDYGDIMYHVDQDYREYVRRPIIVTQSRAFSFGNKKYNWMKCKQGLSERDKRENLVMVEKKKQ